MAQWYAHLVFKGDTLLGEGLADFDLVAGTSAPDSGERYTSVIVSGYALYGQLRGFYALGIAQISVDSLTKQAHYLSEQSALHLERMGSLTPAQRAAIRSWLIDLSPAAWANSTQPFRRSLQVESNA